MLIHMLQLRYLSPENTLSDESWLEKKRVNDLFQEHSWFYDNIITHAIENMDDPEFESHTPHETRWCRTDARVFMLQEAWLAKQFYLAAGLPSKLANLPGIIHEDDIDSNAPMVSRFLRPTRRYINLTWDKPGVPASKYAYNMGIYAPELGGIYMR